MLLKVIIVLLMVHSVAQADTLFVERFDDPSMLQRGWYDFSTGTVDSSTFLQGSASLACHFAQGATTPTPVKGMRRQFAPSQSVYVRYYVKYSENWTGSNKPYHPHEFSFTTNADDKYVGPAWTHLTTYIEHNEGVPVLALQDGRNIDASKARQDISAATQNRSTCGCNGTIDGYTTDCYQSGSEWRNGKQWRATDIWFADAPGPRYKSDWHKIEAYFQLNSIQDGRGLTDGIVRYWYDNELVLEKIDVEMRTSAQPTLAFNQFLVVPYIGDGSPLAQSMWIDDLVVGTKRTPEVVSSVSGATSNNNDIRTAFDINSATRNEPVAVYDLYGRYVADSYYSAPSGLLLFVRASTTNTTAIFAWKE